MLNDQSYIPTYFKYNVELNNNGIRTYLNAIAETPLVINAFNFDSTEYKYVIDTRLERDFKKNHLKNCMNIQATEKWHKFETWLGSLVSPDEKFSIIIENATCKDYIMERIARIGYEKNVEQIVTMPLNKAIEDRAFDFYHFKENPKDYTVIDIRNESEFKEEPYFEHAINIPLHELANHTDLTVELSFASDMGVMNSRFPKASELINKNMTDSVEIEISDEDMADVDFYLHTLGVPARRKVNDPEVLRGEKLFIEATCDQCHVKTLRTQPEGATLIDGTKLPQLGNQEIHPFTDYLLHDMGDELGDDVTMGMAEGNEWRTAPLWGIGLQNTVNGHNSFLHDARARNFVEAIMWHGGEGAYSRDKFANMNKSDRDALVAYLKSL